MSQESIIGIVISVGLALLIYFFPRERLAKLFKKNNLDDFIKNNKFRDNFKIVIIDDEIDSYPVEYIKKLGAEVSTYETISFADSVDITKYDLVFLDIKGVVKEDLEEGGAKFIKIIKQARRHLPVIAVSSGFFHAEFNEYFKMSDQTIKKPINEYDINQLISEIKAQHFDMSSLTKSLKKSIGTLNVKQKSKLNLENKIVNYLEGNTSKSDTMECIHQVATTESGKLIDLVEIIKDRAQND